MAPFAFLAPRRGLRIRLPLPVRHACELPSGNPKLALRGWLAYNSPTEVRSMKGDMFGRLLSFLNDLEQRDLHYTLAHHRGEAILVLIAVPGERWEVEFLS